MAVLFTVFLFSPVFLFEQLNAIMLLFGYFIVLLFIGVPIAFSLGIASLMTVLGANTLPVDYLASVAFTSIDSFPIMAIPFFIAAGIFMGAGGLSHRLLALADEVVGGLSGGSLSPVSPRACSSPQSAVLGPPPWRPSAR